MYDIYIKNYYGEDGILNREETRLYSIPITQEDKDYVLTDPSVSCELGKTGSFEFTIYPNHPYYHAIAQMRTIMRVNYDGDTIFRGRVLTIDNTLTGAKKVHCEGDMAFLLDSFQMGTKEEDRPTISLSSYIANILNNHNNQMSESGELDKCIYYGFCPGNYPSSFSEEQRIADRNDKFGSNGHEQSMNALEDLSKTYGGFFRTRYNPDDGRTYLDWCRHWFRKNLEESQPIAITQNIIDAQSNSEVDNIFTALIPVGKKEGEDIFINGYRTDIHGDNNRILVPQITRVYNASQLSNGYVTRELFEKAVDQYGIIYKVQSFSNADTQEKLWTYACEWIKDNYVGGITNYDLSAVDMHHINGEVEKYIAGDCIQLTLPSDMTELDEYERERSTTINRTLLSIKYNLHNPDKNSYTAGISSDILNREYGTASTSKSKSGGGGGGGGAGAKMGGAGNSQKKIGGDSEMTEQELEILANRYIISKKYNNDLYKKLIDEDPTGARAEAAEKASHVALMQDMRGTEILADGSKEERDYGVATTLALDAAKGVLTFFTPVVKILGSDEDGRKITEMTASKSLEIDGYRRYLEVKGLPTYEEDPTIQKISEGFDVISNAASVFIDPLNVFGFRSKKQGAEMTFTGGTKEDNKETASINGENGWLGIIKSVFGNDGSADESKATIVQDGSGTGSETVGKKNGQWLIQMNKPLQYQYEDGSIYTVPDGTIDAKDFSLIQNAKSIPSISSKFIAVDNLIATTINTVNLKADKADITTLSAKVAKIDEVVSNAITTSYLKSNSVEIKGLTVTDNFVVKNYSFGPKLFSSLGAGSYVLAHGG